MKHDNYDPNQGPDLVVPEINGSIENQPSLELFNPDLQRKYHSFASS
jgi:hypothetical protein